MKKLRIGIFALLIISSCSNFKEEKNSFLGHSYRLVNTEIFNYPVEYSTWEFLDNGKLIGVAKWDSMVAQQINHWEYFVQGENEFLVLEELEQMVDTFKLIRNDNYSYFEFIGKSGDTLKFEEIKKTPLFDTSLILNTNWIAKNDSFFIGKYDSIHERFIHAFPEYHFFDNYEYSIKLNGTIKGNWKFNSKGDKIFLDSLIYHKQIIVLEKVTKDTLIFWKRDHYTRKPKKMICVSCNSV
ncbi:hypothetical protein ACFLSE_08710 [Bacteroidota bacterium]